jgi:hypothetical protein
VIALWPYIVACDLDDPEYYSEALSTILRDIGAMRLTATAWLIASDWNANAILEQLRPVIGRNDRLLVLELGEDFAALNIVEYRHFLSGVSPRPPRLPILKR